MKSKDENNDYKNWKKTQNLKDKISFFFLGFLTQEIKKQSMDKIV